MWKKFKKKVEEYAIWLMLIIPLGAMVIWNVRLFANNNSTVMNVLYGFISTLIGALIGGFCSLAAAIYAGDQQVKITIKHDAQVKLRDTYYIPLYLEIVKLENCLSSRSKQLNQLYSVEWERIRGAAKVLEIPLQIESSLEAMRKEYLTFKENSSDTIRMEEYLKTVKKAKSDLEGAIRKINRMV